MTRPRRTWRLRLLAVVALLAHLAGAIGLPVPVRALPPAAETTEKTDTTPLVRVRRCGCPVDDQAPCCCCSSRRGCCSKAAKPETPPQGAGKLVWSAGVWTAGCQGEQAGLLRVSVPAVPLPPESEASSPAPLAWVSNIDESAERLPLPFPEPPPRPSAA